MIYFTFFPYKGLGKAAPGKPPCTDGSGKACISVATARHWTGPYNHTTANAGLIIEGEDPSLWQSPRGSWHMVYERYTADHSRSGAHAFSASGLEDWTITPNATWVTTTTALDGGARVKLKKRERYQIVLDAEGHPDMLFNGGAGAGHDEAFNMVELFN